MRSVRYGLGVLRTSAQYRLHRRGLRRYPYLDVKSLAAGEDAAAPTADDSGRQEGAG